MDGERFDAWTRTLGAGVSRRRLLAGFGALAGGLLGRGVAGQETGVATCRERLARCDRRDQCCEAQEGHRIGCAQLSEVCFSDADGERCCGRGGATCNSPCDCCAGYGCQEGGCRPLEECRPNTCCSCYRCGGDSCELLFCGTRLGREACVDRCRERGGRTSFHDQDRFGVEVTYACRRFGCDVACGDEFR